MNKCKQELREEELPFHREFTASFAYQDQFGTDCDTIQPGSLLFSNSLEHADRVTDNSFGRSRPRQKEMHLMIINRLAVAFGALLLTGTIANAQTTSGGTLQLSGELQPSIELIFPEGGSIVLTGTDTSVAAAGVGTVSMYGTLTGIQPSGFTKSDQAGVGFTMTGTFEIQVNEANLGSSTTYGLTASLASSDSASYTIGGTTIANGSPATLTGGAYGTPVVQTLAIQFPVSEAVGTVANTINFTATAI